MRFSVFGVWTPRRNFTSHLHSAFDRKGIVAFMDNALDRGEQITPAILKAIEQSNVSVVIFSKNYASSPWCLDELVKINECMVLRGHKVLPVFYDVDPSDVEKQAGSYGDAFVEYEELFKDDMCKVRKWRTTLTEAAYLSGWDSRNMSSDSELVEEIVEATLKIMRNLPSCPFDDLVGIESQIEQIKSLLCIGEEEVLVIGIWGMGGVGKTTLAKVVFEKYAHHFEGTCFLENIREASATRQGLANKHDELVTKLLNIRMSNPSSMKRLCCKKVFVVVDDVDDFQQLELLVGKNSWFGAGSRIIITSRDKQALRNKVDEIYEVQVLSSLHSLRLFSMFAFKADQPKPAYIELSNRVVSYVNGIPLALKVFGSLLYGRSEQQWESAINRLEKTPNMQVQKVLRISFDGLDHDEQQIFLDIACFLKGWSVYFVAKLFESCGYYSLISLKALADKALIVVNDSKVEMHDLLQEMGRQIVRHESMKDPGKRSRLWDPEEIEYVLAENMGSEAIEGMLLDQSKISRFSIDSKVFNRTKGLKWLSFHSRNSRTNGIKWLNLENYGNDLQFPRGLESLPSKLRFLQWDFFPLKSLPSSFRAEHLIFLSISSSPVERLWDGVQNVANLSVLELCHCRRLIELPDLSRAQKLWSIDCRGCINLQEVTPSIGYLKNLSHLILRLCKAIRSVPTTKHLTSLSLLDVSGCSNLEQLPEVSSNVQSLFCFGTSVEKSSESKDVLSRLGSRFCQNNPSMELKISGKYCYVLESSYSPILPSLPDNKSQNENSCTDADIIPQETIQYECIREQSPSNGRYQAAFNNFSFLNLAKLDHQLHEDVLNNSLELVQFYGGATLVLTKGILNEEIDDEYESRGSSSVTIKLPPNWFRSNFMGFNVHVFLMFDDNNDKEIDNELGIRWKCRFKSRCGEVRVASALYQYYPPINAKNCPILVYGMPTNPSLILDKVWFQRNWCYEASFEAGIEHSSAKHCYEIKKMVARMLYLGDDEGNPPVIRHLGLNGSPYEETVPRSIETSILPCTELQNAQSLV